MIHNPTAEAHLELENVRRDIATIDVRIEWLQRYVDEHDQLTEQRAALTKQERALAKNN